jgi:2-oxoisovalerate dehydrogenase E1 component beta subunit
VTQIIERPPMHGDDVPEPRGPMLTTMQAAPTLTMAHAINRALHDAMACDDRVLVFGEDVAKLGGVFRVTEGLAETFGEQRCFDTPLAESGIVGIAIGLAIRGLVPVPEIQFDGFAAPAFDQMVSHLAKYRMRTRGDVDMPVTIRIPSFGGIGAVEHHSESTESYWLHTAGLKVVVPSTPSDAYWLLRQAIVSRDPVIYLEPKRRYWTREAVDTTAPALPIGRAAVRRTGADVTVVTYGSLVATALIAADLAADQHDWSLEVIDLRSLNPLGAQVRPRGGDARRPAHTGLRRRVGGPYSGRAFLRSGGTGVARHGV